MRYQRYKIAPVIWRGQVYFTIYKRHWLGFWTKPLMYHQTQEKAEEQMRELLTPEKFFGKRN